MEYPGRVQHRKSPHPVDVPLAWLGPLLSSASDDPQSLPPNQVGHNKLALSVLFERLPLPVMVTRLGDGQVLYANHHLETLLGLSTTDALQSYSTQFYAHLQDRAVLLQKLQQYGWLERYLVQAKHVDGETFWVAASLQLIRFGGEELILSVFYDVAVADPVDCPEHWQSLAAELQENQRIFSTLLGNLPGMVYRCRNDAHWTIEFVSEGCLGLTGYAPFDLIGNRHCAFSELIAPDDRDRVRQEIQQALAAGEPFRLTYRMITADGTEKWVWEQGCGIVHSNGTLHTLEGFVTDITAQKQAEATMSLLQAVMQAINEAPSFRAALKATLQLMADAIGWELGEAWVARAGESVLECRAGWCWTAQELKADPVPMNGNHHGDPLAIAPALSLDEFHRLSRVFTFSPGKGLVGRVWQSLQTEWIDDASLCHHDHFHRTQIARAAGLRSGFGIPIVADGKSVAVLLFFALKAQTRERSQMEMVAGVAEQLGAALLRKQVEEALKLAEEKYRGIFENAIEGIFQTTPDGRYISANPALARIYGYDAPEQLIRDLTDINRQLYVNPQRRLEFVRLMQTQNSVVNFESQIYRKDGSTIWIVENARVVRDENGALLYYEGTVEDITQRKQLEAKLRHDALHDTLTGLANRKLFSEQLQAVMMQAESDSNYLFAVCYLDLDRFKIVNDSLGHGVGDRLLVEVSQRLKQCVRPGDTVARMGGDEFAILLDRLHDAEAAIAVAERLQKAICQPFHLDRHEIFTSTSVGITLNTLHRRNAEDFLRDADAAMYRAKMLGKARYELFTPSMHARAMALLRVETELRRAVEYGDELTVYYQPIFALQTQQLQGFEALVRWQHPERGLVKPDEFIAIAEETGLIVPIGWWVMRQACQQMYQWRAQFPHLAHLTMSVNLAGQQFSQIDVLKRVDTILQATQLPASALRLELTESQIMQHAAVATTVLENFRKIGIELCIDDFGTGYSSLSYLHRFPTNLLKIDRSFVRGLGIDPSSAEIARTSTLLAHNLNMAAIAEGIETEAQLAQLQALGCEFGQGFFFSRPLNPQAATAFVAELPVESEGVHRD